MLLLFNSWEILAYISKRTKKVSNNSSSTMGHQLEEKTCMRKVPCTSCCLRFVLGWTRYAAKGKHKAVCSRHLFRSIVNSWRVRIRTFSEAHCITSSRWGPHLGWMFSKEVWIRMWNWERHSPAHNAFHCFVDVLLLAHGHHGGKNDAKIISLVSNNWF